MEYLVRQVSEMKRAQELQTISILMKENQLLWKEVAICRRLWNGIIVMMTEAIEAMKCIETALENFSTETAAAERDWLAFWGIYRESVDYIGSKPPRWI
jgi:hypothetical protein